MFRKTIVIILFITIAVGGYFIFIKKESNNINVVTQFSVEDKKNSEKAEKDGLKTFVFNSFHGSNDISDKFQLQYPVDWFNDGQYFSPVKIQFYNKFNVKAPIYFDLILAEVFHLTELQYQIDNSKRRAPDSVGQIAGREFKRYDLTDYGSYGGDSAGQVKIFVGPKIKIDGSDYILVFHWEENPLAEYVVGNNVEVFDNMLLTLKFFK